MPGVHDALLVLLLAACGSPSDGGASSDPAAQAEPAPPEPPPPPIADQPPRQPTPPQGGAAACPARAQWPEGMSCVLGGSFQRGSTDGREDERPPGEAYVDTFYMDVNEVTNAEFNACIRSGRCTRPMPFRHFGGDRQPVVAVSWQDANTVCEIRGARLPTEAEWERAARGVENTTYSWGNEAENACERGNIKDPSLGRGCGRDVTRDVGSFPAGHFGLHDMTGNVHEWVLDFHSDCYRGCDHECGDACFGRNPRGPCNGVAPCRGFALREVRGGSWYWPLERARTAARRGSGPRNLGPHRFGFRCARDLVVAASP